MRTNWCVTLFFASTLLLLCACSDNSQKAPPKDRSNATLPEMVHPVLSGKSVYELGADIEVSIPGSIAEAVEPRILSGKDTEVLSYCDRHLAYHPDDIQVRWYRAVAMHRLGQKTEATKELRQISGVDTNWSEYIKTYVEWLEGDDRWTLSTQQPDAEVPSEGAPSD